MRPPMEEFVGGQARVADSWIEDGLADLSTALAWRRRLVYVAVVIGFAIVASLGWRATDSGGLAPNIAPLLGLAACGAALGYCWLRHQDVIAAADDVILAEVSGGDESAAHRAVAKRVRSLESRRYRESLAEELRWQLRLADEAAVAETAGARPVRISTLNPEQRRALIADRAHVTAMADTVELNEVDPRALILLWRVSDSSPMSAADHPNSGATLTRRLRQAWMLLNRPANAPSSPRALTTGIRAVAS